MKKDLAIEVNVGEPRAAVSAAGDVSLPRTARINLTLRRRRLRRLQRALGLAAWIAGGSALLFVATAGLLSLH